MTLMEKAAHAAERKAFEKVLDNFIQKGKTADAASAAQDLVDMAEKIQGSVWKKESFEVLHMIARSAGGQVGALCPANSGRNRPLYSQNLPHQRGV